jgi:hypothetical protein
VAHPSIPVVVLTGTVGAGKTTVAFEMSAQLASRDIPHAVVDLDALSYVYPRPPDDPFGRQVALANLAAVWTNDRRAGAERLILVRVVEDTSDLDALRSAIPGAAITVCRVLASAAVVDQRIRHREAGSGLDWHLRRAPELDAILDSAAVEDLCVDNNRRPVHEVAQEVLHRIGW